MLRFLYYYILYQYRTILQKLTDPKFRSFLIGIELALIFAIQAIETAIYLACYIIKRALFIAAALSLAQIVWEWLASEMQSFEEEGKAEVEVEVEVLIGVKVAVELDETEKRSKGVEGKYIGSWSGSEGEDIGGPVEVQVVGGWIEVD
jgi:hypothetical protein